jgi:hypothetical protein
LTALDLYFSDFDRTGLEAHVNALIPHSSTFIRMRNTDAAIAPMSRMISFQALLLGGMFFFLENKAKSVKNLFQNCVPKTA